MTMTDHRIDHAQNLAVQGRREDDEMDLAECALLLAGLDNREADLTPFRHHLNEIARGVEAAALGTEAGRASHRARALSEVMVGKYKYQGDTLSYDDPRNANLIHVIERRKGLPVALAILYIHAARALGWPATGINFPGHFLIRLEGSEGRIILDPFNGGIERDVADLRGLLKQVAGIDAELLPDHYAPIGNRLTLIRLLNNIKLRAAAAQEKDRVAEILDRMVLVAPDDVSLLREAGQVHAETGNLRRAIETLERALTHGADNPLRRETEALLRQVRSRLN